MSSHHSDEGLRRSQRQNIGQPPARLGEWNAPPPRTVPIMESEAARNSVRRSVSPGEGARMSPPPSPLANSGSLNVSRPSLGQSANVHQIGMSRPPSAGNLNHLITSGRSNESRPSVGQPASGYHTPTGSKSTATRRSNFSSVTRERLRKQVELEALEKEAARQAALDQLESKRKELEREAELQRMRNEIELLQIDEIPDTQSQDLDDDERIPSGNPVADVNQWVDDTQHVTPTYPLDTSPQIEVTTPEPKLSDMITLLVDALKGREKSTNTSEKFMARQTIRRDLPEFNGEPEEWPRFIAAYRSSTDSCGYKDEENLDRLQKCLKRKALARVQGMMTDPANLKEIMEALEERFGKPAHIVQNLIMKTRQIAPVREEKLESILTLSDAVNNLVAVMETLHYTGHMTNPQLLTDLVEKLPTSLKLKWGSQVQKKYAGSPNLKDFSTWLTNIAKCVNNVTIPNTLKEEKKSEFKQKQDNLKGRRESVFAAKEVPATLQFCYNCDKSSHNIQNCNSFKKKSVSERWDLLKEKRLCTGCLQQGHMWKNCEKKTKCKVDGCVKTHHHLLHSNRSEEPKTEVCGHTTQKEEKPIVLLEYMPVTLTGPSGSIETFAFLDNGSTCSLLDASVANQLGLKGPIDPLRLRWTSDISQEDKMSRRVSLRITGENGITFDIDNLRTKQKMNLPVQSVDMKKLAQRWNHLATKTVSSYGNEKPTILLGKDHGDLTMIREFVEGPKNSPTLSRCHLGWFVHGRQDTRNRLDVEHSYHMRDIDNNQLHELMKESFKTEDFGVKITCPARPKEDVRAEELLQKTTRRIGERFETGLLWRSDNIVLPESKQNAMLRLRQMENKMDKNRDFGKWYGEKVGEYVSKDYARKLTPEEVEVNHPRTWYLPHFGVVEPNKPGKIRLVFDAAAKSHGVSLNSQLLKGPDMLCPLISVIFKFRQKRIGIGADVKEMFHQVKIIEEDLHAQRFLFRGMDRDREPDVYQMVAMTFGSTSSPCSAQYVKNKNAEEFAEEFPEAARTTIKNQYVDDYYNSVDTIEEGKRSVDDVLEVQRRGGFELRKWTSSCMDVIKHLPTDFKATGDKQVGDNGETANERILGVRWNRAGDYFTFQKKFDKIEVAILNGTKTPTKRDVLRVLMSLYDPLGFVAHFTVKAKILIQDIWRLGVGWEDEIPSSLLPMWKIWIEDLHKIETVKIPRSYITRKSSEVKNLQLHVFVDASESAFSAVTYIRSEYVDDVEIGFVMAKSRVAPLRSLSIPRLELQAALMGSRLSKMLEHEHDVKINKTTYWTDSKTVLCWLTSESRRFKMFIAHRVGEIEELTDVNDWRWINTHDNVADDATRGNSQTDFNPAGRWFVGPEFLHKTEIEWPQGKESESVQINEDELELKREFMGLHSDSDGFLPEPKRFSSWNKLVRCTAWILRFIYNCQARSKGWKLRKCEILVEEAKMAEIVLLKKIQSDSFANELNCAQNEEPVSKSSKLISLSPIMASDGLLKIDGRIGKANIEVGVKTPIILDPKHPFTRLLIRQYHVNNLHHGQERVVNELRQRFWILDIRAAVRSTWNSCQLCKNARAKVVIPKMGNLPDCRVDTYIRPFTNVGMDYFGPMEVVIGRRREKRYGVLFTCLSTRAIHLEIAASLDTDSAIMAIRRLVGRRGCPIRIYSDNGTNFRGAQNELQKCIQDFDQNKVINLLTGMEIEWHFIPPVSPHMGGAWERLVKTVKTALSYTLKKQAVKEEVLQTLMVEAESLVNSRPLTHVPIDHKDEECITPNCFLIGTPSASQPPGIFTDDDLCLRKKWRISQRLADQFWKRFVKEYLPTLVRRQKWQGETTQLKIDDVVLIADDNMPRGTWPKGIIVAVYPGADQQIRVVDVKTTIGTFKRPVHKIAKLDVLNDVEDLLDSSTGGSM